MWQYFDTVILFGSSLVSVDRALRDIARAARHTCRLILDDAPANFANGVLVGSDLVLTAAHAFFDAAGAPIVSRVRDRVTVEIDGCTVSLHDRWLVAPSIGENGCAGRDVDRLDYALLRLRGDVASDWCALPSEDNAPILVPGLVVHIVQHVDRDSPRIASGQVTGVSPDRMRVRYTASALPSASGSPVFDDSFRLVALHVERGDDSNPAHNLGLPIRRVSLDLEHRKGESL